MRTSLVFLRAVFLLFLAVLLSASAAIPVAGSEIERIVGTPVSLIPPAGFTPSKLAAGYDMPSSGASISVMEAPDEAFPQFESLKDPAAASAQFEKLGLPATATSEIVVAGARQYILVSAQVEMVGYKGDLWMAVTGPSPSVVINFSQIHIPGLPVALDRNAVLTILRSVVLAAPTSFEDQLITTGLTLRPKPPFTVAKEVFAGRMIVLSTVKDTSEDHSAPSVLVLVLPIGSEKASLSTLADHYARDEDGPITDTVSRSVHFVGEEGLRLEGKRTSADGVAERFVVHVAVADDRAFVLVGAGRENDMTDGVVTAIDDIAASVQKQQMNASNAGGELK